MQRDYVVKFLVEDVPQDAEEALLSDGRFAVSRRCGRTVIEGEDSAADAVAAAKAMAEHLRLSRVSIRSVMPELVTMADIHRRAGVSKQAVSKWVNNPRDNEFPEPHCFTDSSPLWQWQLVNEWLRAKEHQHDDWDVPTEGEVARINEWLATSLDPRRRADHRPTIVRQGEPLMATTQPYRYDSVSV